MIRICVQEQHLPGATLEEKFEKATAWGFDGIELRGARRSRLRGAASRAPQPRPPAAS